MSGVGYRGRSFGSENNYNSPANNSRDGSSRISDRGYSRDYNSSRREGHQSNEWSQSRSFTRWGEPQQNNSSPMPPQPWAQSNRDLQHCQDSVRHQYHHDAPYDNGNNNYNNNYRGTQRNFYSYGRNRYSTPQRGHRQSFYLPYYSAPYRERSYEREKSEPPPPPPPGSEEERQQKITEAAEELKKTLRLKSASKGSPSFWEDDSAAAQDLMNKNDSFVIKSIPAVENGPSELSLTTNDLKDIGRVNNESTIDHPATEIDQRSSRRSTDDGGKSSDSPSHSRGSSESTREIKTASREKSRTETSGERKRSEGRRSRSPQAAQEAAKSGSSLRETEHRGKSAKERRHRTRMDTSPRREENYANTRIINNNYNSEFMEPPAPFDVRPRHLPLAPIVPDFYALPPPPPPLVPRPEDSHPSAAYNLHMCTIPSPNLPPAPMPNYARYPVPFVPPLPMTYPPMMSPMEYPPLPAQSNFNERRSTSGISREQFINNETMSDEEDPIEFPTFPDLPPVNSATKTMAKRLRMARKSVKELDVPLPDSLPSASRFINREEFAEDSFNSNFRKLNKYDEWGEEDLRKRLKSSMTTAMTTPPRSTRVRSSSEGKNSEPIKNVEKASDVSKTMDKNLDLRNTLRKSAKSNTVVDPNWKDKVIGRFLQMSKNDIQNMINNSSLKKFDIAMQHLVKEKKSSLSQEMRNTENEKMKMSSYESENFMYQLQAILDPAATVDITNLPSTFIHQLSEVLHLDQQAQEGHEIDEYAGNTALTAIFHQTPSSSKIDAPQTNNPPPLSSSPSAPGISSHETSKPRKINNKASKDTPRNPSAPTSACYTRTGDKRGSPEPPNVRRSTNNLSSSRSGHPDTLNMDALDDIFEAGIARVKTTKSTTQSTSKISSTFLDSSTPPLPPPPPDAEVPSAQTRTGLATVVPVERQAVELDKIFTAGIAKAKAASMKVAAAAAAINDEPSHVPRSRRVARRGGPRSTNANVTDTWRRKDVANSDIYRNLTKEEYEAKLEGSSSLHYDNEYRRVADVNSTVNGRENIAHADNYYSHSPSHAVRMGSSVSNSEDSNNSCCSESSSDSSSSSSSDDESPSMGEFSKVLKYIKEREKIAKKKSINEEIRDEVNAEIEKKRREKSLKRKARKSRSKKREKRKKDKKGKKRKKKHRHKSHHSTRSEGSVGEKEISGPYLSEYQIKREPKDSEEEPVVAERAKKSASTEPVQVSKASSTVTSSPTSQVTSVSPPITYSSKPSSAPPNTKISTTKTTVSNTLTLKTTSSPPLATVSLCPSEINSPNTAQHLKTKAQLKQMPDPLDKSITSMDESVQSKNSEPVTSSTSTPAYEPPVTRQPDISTTATNSEKAPREKSPQERSSEHKQSEKTGKIIEKSDVGHDDSNMQLKVAILNAINDKKTRVESPKTVGHAPPAPAPSIISKTLKRTQKKSDEIKIPKNTPITDHVESPPVRRKLQRACKSTVSQLDSESQDEMKFVNIKSEGGKELKLREKVKKRPQKSGKMMPNSDKNEKQSNKSSAHRVKQKSSASSKSADGTKLDIPTKIPFSTDKKQTKKRAEPMDTGESNLGESSTPSGQQRVENERPIKHEPTELVDAVTINAEPTPNYSIQANRHASIFSHYFQFKIELVSDNLPDTVPEENLTENIESLTTTKIIKLPQLVNLTKGNMEPCMEGRNECQIDETDEIPINEIPNVHSSDKDQDDQDSMAAISQSRKTTNEWNSPADNGARIENVVERSFTPLPMRGDSPLDASEHQVEVSPLVDYVEECRDPLMAVPEADKTPNEPLPESTDVFNQDADNADIDDGINEPTDESPPNNQELAETANAMKVIDEAGGDVETRERPVDVGTDSVISEPMCQAIESSLAAPDEKKIEWNEGREGDHDADEFPDEQPLLEEISPCFGPEICFKTSPKYSHILNDKVLVAESTQNDILDDPITFSAELKCSPSDSMEFGAFEDTDGIGESLDHAYPLEENAVAISNDFEILPESTCAPEENIMDNPSIADKELMKVVEKKSSERLPSPILQSSKSPDGKISSEETPSEISHGEVTEEIRKTHKNKTDSTTLNIVEPEIPSSTTQITEPSSSEHEEFDKSSESHSTSREKLQRSVSSVRTPVNARKKESHRSKHSKNHDLPQKLCKSNAITERKKRKEHNHEKRRHNITIEHVSEAATTNIIQIVPKEKTKDAVIARMQEIDLTIQRLMNEKMTLYQMLQNDRWPASENVLQKAPETNISNEVSTSGTKSFEKVTKHTAKVTARQTNDDSKRPAETTVSAEAPKSQKQDSHAPTRALKSDDRTSHRLGDELSSKSGRKRRQREDKTSQKGKDTREEPEAKRKHTEEPSKPRKAKSPTRSAIEEARKPAKEINRAPKQSSKSKVEKSKPTDTSESCEMTDHSRSMDTPVRETSKIKSSETIVSIYSDDSTWDTFEQVVEKRERARGLTLLEESMKREMAASKSKNEGRKRVLHTTDEEDDDEDIPLSKAIAKREKVLRKKPQISRKGSKKHEKSKNHVLEVMNTGTSNRSGKNEVTKARSDNSNIETDKTKEIMRAPAPVKHAVNSSNKKSANLKSADVSLLYTRLFGDEDSISDEWTKVGCEGDRQPRQSVLSSTMLVSTRGVSKNDAEPTSSTVEKVQSSTKKIRTSEIETTEDFVSDSGRKSRPVHSEHSDANDLNSTTKGRTEQPEAVGLEKTKDSSFADAKCKLSNDRENEYEQKSPTLTKTTEKKSGDIKKSISVKTEKHSRDFDQERRSKSTVKELMRSKSTTKELERPKSTVKELERSKSTVKELEAIDSHDDELNEIFRKKRSRHRKSRNTSRSRGRSRLSSDRSRKTSRSRSRSMRKGKSPSSRDVSPHDLEHRRRPSSGDLRRSNTTPFTSDRATMDNRAHRRSRKRKLSERAIEQMRNCQVKLVDCKHTYLRPDLDPKVLQAIGVSRISIPRSPDRLPSPELHLDDESEPPLDEEGNRSDESIVMVQVEPEDLREMEEFAGSSDTKDDSHVLSTPPSLQTSPIVLPIDDDDEDLKNENFSQKQPESEPQATQYTVHKGPILDIKVFGDSFFAASEDGSTYRYSRRSNGILNIYKGHEAAVTCIYVHESSEPSDQDCTEQHLFSGSLDTTLRCYDVITGSLYRPVAEIGSPIQCMDHAWGVVFIGTKSGHISRYDIKAGSLRDEKLDFSDKPVLALRTSTEGPRKVLIVASRCQPITIRDAQSGLFLRTISDRGNHTIYSLMRERNLVYCGTSTSSILVFDFISGEQVQKYTAGVGIVCLRIHRHLLFAGCYDGNIYVFNTTNSQLVHSIPGPGNMLLSMEIIDNEIIAGSKDRRLYAWKIPSQIGNILLERM